MKKPNVKLSGVEVLSNAFNYLIGLFVCLQSLAQGPYAPAVGQIGSTAIGKNFYAITEWASGCDLQRGYMDIADKGLGFTAFGNSNSAIGQAEGDVVSLGDSGVAILTFNNPITNTEGFDFAVFENSFDDSFLELAFVEVSSDGVNFYRFDAVSLTDTLTQTAPFGATDPTNIFNLAGKYRGQFGTPFDLEELKDEMGLDVNNVTHVKIIDVVGTLDSEFASRDSQGNKINDPYPTAFESGGFDLDGVAVLGDVTSIYEQTDNKLFIYPNPSSNDVYISDNDRYKYILINVFGRQIFEGFDNKIDVSSLANGVYFLTINNQIIRVVKE